MRCGFVDASGHMGLASTMMRRQQHLAMTLMLVYFRQLRLQVFQLPLQGAPMLREQVKKAFKLWRGIAWRFVKIQNFADLTESEP